MEHVVADNGRTTRKGGLRTMPFIIVNLCFVTVAGYGIMPNMIFYLKNEYHMQTATATTILLAWSAISEAMSILGAFLSDSYFGRFCLILVGSIFTFLGMILLWLTAMIPELRPPSCESSNQVCNAPTLPDLALLLFSFVLFSIGAGCFKPCSIAFGADQFEIEQNSGSNRRMLDSYFHWYYAFSGISAFIAYSIMAFIQDNLGWKVGFGVPAILMLLSVLIFMLGSPYYIKVNPEKNSLSNFVQVIVIAFKNRKLSLPSNFDDHCYHNTSDSQLLSSTDSLRCLNKACIVRDDERFLNWDESPALKSRTSCTVEQVESLKAIIRVIPMWSTGILMKLSVNQTSFTTIQANTMDRSVISNLKIPAGSIVIFLIITLTIWIALYDRIIVPLLSKYTGKPRGLNCKVRMGMGLLIAVASTAISAIIETIRRKKAIEQGLEQQGDGIVEMSVFWLVPAQALLGVAEALNSIGQLELYYTCLPKSMSSFAMAIYSLGLAVAYMLGSLLVDTVDVITSEGGRESWLSSNINKGHLDYYYGLLTCLGIINYIYFLVCSSAYGPVVDDEDKSAGALEVTEEDVEKFDYMELYSS